jgi:hypothetical protein
VGKEKTQKLRDIAPISLDRLCRELPLACELAQPEFNLGRKLR